VKKRQAKATTARRAHTQRAASPFAHATREAWLEIEQITPWFAAIPAPLPSHIRVSTGWPSHWSRQHTNLNIALGEYWRVTLAADGVPQIFISPQLDDPIPSLARAELRRVVWIRPSVVYTSRFRLIRNSESV
jgi:hypothetical protein